MLNQGVGTGDYYHLHYGKRDWRSYATILAAVIRHSQPGPILDVGAGVGLLVDCGRRWGIPIDGIEGSETAIALARKRHPAVELKHHLLSKPFPFDDEHFQTAVMNQVIEHLEPEVAAACLQQIHRVLAPGGMLFICSPSKFNVRETRADPTHLHMYSPRELHQLLRSKGFERLIPMNAPLDYLGQKALGKRVMRLIFNVTRWQRLSASANVIGYKA